MTLETTKDRAWLLDHNISKVRQIYADFGDPNAVVLVLDAEDRLGSVLAKALAGEAEYRRMCDECLSRRQTPTLILPLPWEAAVNLLTPTSPNAGRNLHVPLPDGHFRAVVMAKGGNLFASVPAAACLADTHGRGKISVGDTVPADGPTLPA